MKVNFNTKRQKDPTRDKGLKVIYAPAKRRVPKWRWYLILLVVSSPLLYFLFKLILAQVVVTAQGVITLEKIAINSSGTGYVDDILIKAGDTVGPGNVLVKLGSPILDERERVLKAELSNIGSPIPPSGMHTENLLRNRIELAKNDVEYQRDKLSKVQFLFDQGAATIAELNQAKAILSRSKFTLNQAQGELTAHLERTRKEQWQPELRFSARRQMILAELEVIEAQRRRLAQKASFQGRILDIFVDSGQTVSPGSPLILIGKLDDPYIVAYLDPKYAKHALAGRKVTVKMPDRKTFRAAVRENATLTQQMPSNLSSPISGREMMILVKLDFLTPVSDAERIDGIPVTIRFDLKQ